VQRFEAEASAVAAFENGWRERTSNLTEFTLTGPDLYDMGGDGSANSYAYLAYDATWSIIYALQAVVSIPPSPAQSCESDCRNFGGRSRVTRTEG
jgi:hypothetical protein